MKKLLDTIKKETKKLLRELRSQGVFLIDIIGFFLIIVFFISLLNG